MRDRDRLYEYLPACFYELRQTFPHSVLKIAAGFAFLSAGSGDATRVERWRFLIGIEKQDGGPRYTVDARPVELRLLERRYGINGPLNRIVALEIVFKGAVTAEPTGNDAVFEVSCSGFLEKSDWKMTISGPTAS